MNLTTKLIRKGKGATIRAIADIREGRERCKTLEFVNEIRRKHSKELDKLARLWSDTAESGPPINKEKFKKLDGSDDIWEFKTSKLRVLCFRDEGSFIICTHGFVKKSQGTPKKEIKLAEKEKKRYLQAKTEGKLKHEK
jgi:phage-related protein